MPSPNHRQGQVTGPLLIRQPAGLFVALLLPFIAAAAQWILWPYIKPLTWLLFYPVIGFAPLVGGRWGGLGAALLSTLCGWCLFIPQPLAWQFEHPGSFLPILIFLSMGVTFANYHPRFLSLKTTLARLQGEQRFGATYSQSLVGIAETDLSGRLTTVNDRYCEITGYPREELLGKRMQDITHPDDLPRNLKLFAHMQEEGTPFVIEKRYLSKSGAEIWVSNSVTPIFDAGGRQTGCFALVLDLSEHKKLEKEIREQRREQQELLNRLIAGQTTSFIADKLNQPLQAITAYNEAALRMMQTGNPNLERLRYVLETSGEQARRAGNSIRNVLEALSAQDFSAEPIDLHREIHTALAAIRTEHDFPFVATLNLTPEGPFVLGNEAYLQRVFVSLLRNAVESLETAASPSPTLTVSTCLKDRFVMVTLQDNGPGIAPQDLPHLFTPFFTTKSNSFGMGLPISRFLIESHGGKIWVTPTLGPGAEFHLTLPVLT